MGLLPDTQNCEFRMRRECRERFPYRHLQRKPLAGNPGMHHGTCVTHVPWYMSGSLTCGGGKTFPALPSACTTRDFTYLVRGPFHTYLAKCMAAFIKRHVSWSKKKHAWLGHLAKTLVPVTWMCVLKPRPYRRYRGMDGTNLSMNNFTDSMSWHSDCVMPNVIANSSPRDSKHDLKSPCHTFAFTYHKRHAHLQKHAFLQVLWQSALKTHKQFIHVILQPGINMIAKSSPDDSNHDFESPCHTFNLTQQTHYAMKTSLLRQNDAILTSKWRRFDVISTLCSGGGGGGSSWPHFTNGFCITIQIRRKFLFTLTGFKRNYHYIFT